MPSERDRNESGQFTDGIDPETVLAVVDDRDDLARPITANDIVEELGIARRTAHNKLGRLVERGTLDTRKTGAKGRVYWRPIPADEVDSHLLNDRDMFDSDNLEGNPENTIDDEMTNEADRQSSRDEGESIEVSSNEELNELNITKPEITSEDIEQQDDE